MSSQYTWEGVAKEFAALICRDGGHHVIQEGADQDPNKLFQVVLKRFHKNWLAREDVLRDLELCLGVFGEETVPGLKGLVDLVEQYKQKQEP